MIEKETAFLQRLAQHTVILGEAKPIKRASQKLMSDDLMVRVMEDYLRHATREKGLTLKNIRDDWFGTWGPDKVVRALSVLHNSGRLQADYTTGLAVYRLMEIVIAENAE